MPQPISNGESGASIRSKINQAFLDLLDKAAAIHTHTMSSIDGLVAALAGKANSSHTHDATDITGLDAAMSGKQDVLVSGTNIKTVNGASILGAGDLTTVDLTSNQSVGGNKSHTGLLISKPTTTEVGAVAEGGFQVGTNAGTTAVMSFHKNGYAINAGLNSNNVWCLGGWSQGLNVYRIVSDTSGNFTALGNVTAYSDARLKRDLVQIKGALSRVRALTGYTYTRIDTEERQAGLLAQDLQVVLPEVVQESEEGHLSVAYGNLASLFVEAIKELADRVEALEARL